MGRADCACVDGKIQQTCNLSGKGSRGGEGGEGGRGRLQGLSHSKKKSVEEECRRV